MPSKQRFLFNDNRSSKFVYSRLELVTLLQKYASISNWNSLSTDAFLKLVNHHIKETFGSTYALVHLKDKPHFKVKNRPFKKLLRNLALFKPKEQPKKKLSLFAASYGYQYATRPTPAPPVRDTTSIPFYTHASILVQLRDNAEHRAAPVDLHGDQWCYYSQGGQILTYQRDRLGRMLGTPQRWV